RQRQMCIRDRYDTDRSYMERYNIGTIATNVLNKKTKYVVVWPKRDINYFAISIMKLHGLNIRVYPMKSKAEAWLKINE
ncbi:MAG: hypothetical protein KUG68_07035, partial [Flavobacteriaceae bacterium]|nr:hypothetical protein [Flavobacteriaceae bacterium]